MVIMREASELDETVLDRDLCDCGRCRIAIPKDGVNDAKPFIAQERYRSEAESVEECTVQRPSGDVEVRTDLGNVDWSEAGRIEIIVDLSDQLHRRRQGASVVRR